MLGSRPTSQPAALEPAPGRLILDTRFHDKHLRTWITARPHLQPAEGELDGCEQVRVAVLANHHQSTGTLSHLLKTAQNGDALVVVCQTQKAYQAALSYLGYRNAPA